MKIINEGNTQKTAVNLLKCATFHNSRLLNDVIGKKIERLFDDLSIHNKQKTGQLII